jgi:hypothetical protein
MKQFSLLGLSVFLVLFSHDIYSQTNTFPASGNVGIGTTNPSSKLDVIGNVSISGNMRFAPDATYNVISGIYAGGAIKIGTNSSTWDRNLHLGFVDNNQSFFPVLSLIHQTGNVGIWTTSPNRPLQVGSITPGTSSDQDADIISSGGLMILSGKMLSLDHNYYVHAYQKFQGNSEEKGFLHYGYYGHEFSTRTGSAIVIKGNSNKVGIGTSNPQNELDVNGTVRAKEIIATLNGWSDYVFDDDYKLLPLGQLEQYILTNNKLPEVPSAEKVIKDGVSLVEMNTLLLKKVEELTLYLIEQNKKNELIC